MVSLAHPPPQQVRTVANEDLIYEALLEKSNSSSNHLLDIKIEDFSPEWDYTSGGAKLLICIKPSLDDIYEQIESKVTIRFGELDVPVRFL